MEQQAKQRLTGGIILVALLVLLVPELLSGPSTPPPPSQAAPDQAPLRSYTMDLNTGSQHGSAPVAASTQSLEPAPAAPVAAPVESEPPPAPAPAQEQTPAPKPEAPSAPQPPPPAATARPADEPRRVEPAQAAPKPAHAHEARSEAKGEGRGEARSETRGEWTVQLGVFSNHANAQRLAATLEHKGFAVKVTEIGPEGRRRYRVRVGSAHDRAGALRLLAHLKAAGQHDGAIVPP